MPCHYRSALDCKTEISHSSTIHLHSHAFRKILTLNLKILKIGKTKFDMKCNFVLYQGTPLCTFLPGDPCATGQYNDFVKTTSSDIPFLRFTHASSAFQRCCKIGGVFISTTTLQILQTINCQLSIKMVQPFKLSKSVLRRVWFQNHFRWCIYEYFDNFCMNLLWLIRNCGLWQSNIYVKIFALCYHVHS